MTRFAAVSARVMTIAACLAPAMAAHSQEPPAGRETDVSGRGGSATPWTQVEEPERNVVIEMIRSEDWAYRALALMRLDRFEGDEVENLITATLVDTQWQVRCFAIRHAWRHGVKIDPASFAKEEDPRVLRAALHYSVALPEQLVSDTANRLLKVRTVDALLMGIELAALSTDDQVRRAATQRALTLARNMDPQLAAVVSRRLARVFQIDPAPADALQWRGWVSQVPREYILPRPAMPTDLGAASLIAKADAETFIRLRDYMGGLRRRDLEMIICIDATNSMMPMIDEVKADVDALILFLSDLSSTMRLGLVAYRDHDNPGKLIEGHPFSVNLESLRNFLFGLTTPGGATYPEAVLDGLRACGPRQFDWQEQAEREIILIGDAPPHDKDHSEVRALLEWYAQAGFAVHAVHVPMEFPAGYLQSLPPASAQEREQWRQDYNIGTKRVFQDIANIGGGQLVELDTESQHDLARSIMKLTLLPEWWPYFDEFYDGYLELCR